MRANTVFITSERSFCAALLCGVMVMAVGCGSTGRPAGEAGGRNVSRSIEDPFANARATADGSAFVRCLPHPLPIESNRMFTMTVSVYEDAELSRPAANAGVHADADMPEHGHGMTLVPRVSRMSPGVFRVEGMLMHMPGAWEIYIDVEREGRTGRATFPVEVP